jgi:hypothetical protein
MRRDTPVNTGGGRGRGGRGTHLQALLRRGVLECIEIDIEHT